MVIISVVCLTKILCFVWHQNVNMVIISVVCLTKILCFVWHQNVNMVIISVFCLTKILCFVWHQNVNMVIISVVCLTKILCFVWHQNVNMVIISVVCLTKILCFVWHQNVNMVIINVVCQQKNSVFCLTQKCQHGYHQRGLSDRKIMCFVWHKNVNMVIINVVCPTEKSACRWTFTALSPATGCPMPSSTGRSWWPTPSSYACATAWFWCPLRTACFTGHVLTGASSTWPATWGPRRSTCVRRPDWMRWVTMQKRIKQQQQQKQLTRRSKHIRG